MICRVLASESSVSIAAVALLSNHSEKLISLVLVKLAKYVLVKTLGFVNSSVALLVLVLSLLESRSVLVTTIMWILQLFSGCLQECQLHSRPVILVAL